MLLVAVIVLVNAYIRCYVVWEHDRLKHWFCTDGPLCPGCGISTFTKDEWLRVVWPWR